MSHEANHIYFSCLIPVRIVFCVAICCCNNRFNETYFMSMVFHLSHWPNGLCPLGDDKCEEITWEVNYTYLWSHQIQDALGHNAYSSMIFPSSFTTGRHSQWWPSTLHLMHSWAQLHKQSLIGICLSKKGSYWMNLSFGWPTTVWLKLLLHPYQLIVDCCNIFTCNRAVNFACVDTSHLLWQSRSSWSSSGIGI